MDDLEKKVYDLSEQINLAIERLHIVKASEDIADLKKRSQEPDFWDDNIAAQESMKKLAKLEAKASPWLELEATLKDLQDLLKMNDPSLKEELVEQYKQLENKFINYKELLKFEGPYDDHNALVSIYAGAGGTDAQDWAQMLFRMYSRYFEKNNWKTKVIDESAGDEAGLKSITLEVDGDYAYGKLIGEHGVHRLVRLSPFNADNLRQTSFAKVEVLPKIVLSDNLEIDDKDLKIDVFRSGGHGGQSVNTTDSAVRITYLPSGMSVVIQNERSQLQNREMAMTILRSRLVRLQIEQHQDKLSELKGPNQSAEWGNQIRNYVLHPYKQIKDLRTGVQSSDPESVLNGDLDTFINAYLEYNIS